jgi:hypothetical protein
MKDVDKGLGGTRCSTAEFKESYVQTFMGGEFSLKEIRTVGDLRRGLESWLAEINGWSGDDTKIGECELHRGRLIVTLQHGIVQ